MSEELEKVEPNPHKTGTGRKTRYSDAVRDEFGILLANGLPLGTIRSELGTKFDITIPTHALKHWRTVLLRDAKGARPPSDKERRVEEYLAVLDTVASHNADTIADLVEQNEERGGVGEMSKTLSDGEYLEFQNKSFNLIHRQAVDGIRLFSDEHSASNLPEFILMAFKQSKEPPHGDSDTGDAGERIIDADFKQVADIPATRISPSPGSSD